MKRMIPLLLFAILMVPTAQSQKVVVVKNYYKKQFIFDVDTVRRATVKVVKIMTVAPKSDSGFRRNYGYNKPKDTTYAEYEDIKIDSVFAVKNYGSYDFEYFISPDYYTAYSKPNQKIFAESPVNNEYFTTYSNYFLTREEGAKNFYVIYHADAKVPYFELGMDKSSQTSVPWLRLLAVLFALSFCARKIALFFRKKEVFKERSFWKIISGLGFLLVATILTNAVIIGLLFAILFHGESYHQVSVPYNQVLVVWFVRYGVLLFLCLLWNIIDSKKELEKTSENQIDESAGSEQLN